MRSRVESLAARGMPLIGYVPGVATSSVMGRLSAFRCWQSSEPLGSVPIP